MKSWMDCRSMVIYTIVEYIPTPWVEYCTVNVLTERLGLRLFISIRSNMLYSLCIHLHSFLIRDHTFVLLF